MNEFQKNKNVTKAFTIGNLTFYKTIFENSFRDNCQTNFNYESFIFPAVSDETVLMNVKQKPCLPNKLIETNDTRQLLAWYNEAERIYICGSTDRDKATEQEDSTSSRTAPTNLQNEESSTSSTMSISKTKKPKRTEANVALIDKTYYFGGSEAVDVDLYNGSLDYFDDDKEDVATYHFRGLAKLKRAHNEKTKEVLFNCHENKTLFLSFNSGNKYVIDELQKVVRAFQKYLKRKYGNCLKYGVIVYEPNNDGSWHFHCLLCFETVPDNFETCFAKWANNYNNKQGVIEQTDVELLETKQDIRRVWEYLNPAFMKKRERAVFYPENFHNIACFGNRTTPPSMKVTGATLQELLDATDAVELSAEQVVVIDNESGEVNEFADYWFKLDKAKLDKLVGQTIMDAIMCDDEYILTFSLARGDDDEGSRGFPLPNVRCGFPTMPLGYCKAVKPLTATEGDEFSDSKQSKSAPRFSFQRSPQLATI